MEELIINGKNVLSPTDFNANKNELERIRSNISTDVDLPHFKEKVIVFNANVKGADMNGLVLSLQEKLTNIQSTEMKLTDAVGTTIRVIEALDSGYLQGIVTAIKAGQKADSQANAALDEIQSTLLTLQKFKNELKENTKHLSDIDEMWNDIQESIARCETLEKELKDESKKIKSTSEELSLFREKLFRNIHINDIDDIYDDVKTLKKNTESLEEQQRADHSELTQKIEPIQAFCDELKSYNHLGDIDVEWEHSHELANKFDGFSMESAETIKKQENEIEGLQKKIKTLYIILGITAVVAVGGLILGLIGVL